MGLFDAIKDALTVDDQERYEGALKRLENAQEKLDKVLADPNASQGAKDKAQQLVDDLKAEVEEFGTKSGAIVPPAEEAAPVDAAPAEELAVDEPVVVEDPVADTVASAEPVAPVEEAAPAPVEEPVVAEPMAAPAEPVYREYTVVKGDTLSHIGKRFGVKWRDIAELNNIANPDLIFPGQVFKIPN